MNLHPLSLFALLTSVSLTAAAGSLSCPDLASAVQVNACPSEEELQYTYTGYCSDNAKAYANETDSCVRYADYRKMKNVARWESADGIFDGYVSCDLPAEKFKALKASGMKVIRQGKLNKLVCSYPNEISLTYRTKGACAVVDEKTCAADPASCRATCD